MNVNRYSGRTSSWYNDWTTKKKPRIKKFSGKSGCCRRPGLLEQTKTIDRITLWHDRKGLGNTGLPMLFGLPRNGIGFSLLLNVNKPSIR